MSHALTAIVISVALVMLAPGAGRLAEAWAIAQRRPAIGPRALGIDHVPVAVADLEEAGSSFQDITS